MSKPPIPNYIAHATTPERNSGPVLFIALALVLVAVAVVWYQRRKRNEETN